MHSIESLQVVFDELRRNGKQLAGSLTDLSQRATVYHHLFRRSGRNHVFPLIAAHGALWASNYFRFGVKLGWCCSWQYLPSREMRKERLNQLRLFADAFRDINRRVCVDTYASFHFTSQFGEHPAAAKFVRPSLLIALNRCHTAVRRGRELSRAEKRDVFEAFFLNEQETIVGPSIDQATQDFEWPVMKFIALKPYIRFAYFDTHRYLTFRNFTNTHERIENGLHAFDIAADVGWNAVESSLSDYQVLPSAFFRHPEEHFASIRNALSLTSFAK